MSNNTKVQEVNSEEVENLKDLVSIAEEKGLKTAIKEIQNRINRDDQLISIDYSLPCFKHEGAIAVSQAVEKVLGRMEMDGSGMSEKPPQLINVDLPDGTTTKVPWGKIMLPDFDDDCYLELDYYYEEGKLDISGYIRKRHQEKMDLIVATTKEILANSSLYMGTAIELNFDEDDDCEEPKFLNLSNIDENKILFSKNIKNGLIPVISRITQTEECVNQGLDIKLGVLMEGPYGTGKTLTAFWLGKLATQHKWTFIYLKNCKYTESALRIAENYAKNGNGVVLFTEDIDQILRGKRGQEIQDIVNTLDGGDTKNLPIISMFTTNHIEVIDPTFLRGKRIGSLIQFETLDLDTAKQFIDKLVVDKNNVSLMEEGDLTPSYEALCGIVPAFASEVIDFAKAYMVHRESNKISNEDIVTAAISYKKQIEFAECKVIDKSTDDITHALKVIGNFLFDTDSSDAKKPTYLFNK